MAIYPPSAGRDAGTRPATSPSEVSLMTKTDEIAARLKIAIGLRRSVARMIKCSDILALLDERDRMKAALEPFAKHARMMDETFSDHADDCIAARLRDHPITFGDFRRARAALERKP